MDVLERLNALFSAEGKVIQSEVCGSIIMKSYLTGNPIVTLGLNDNLVIGATGVLSNPHYCYIDSMNFNEAAQLDLFKDRKIISLYPQGMFVCVFFLYLSISFSVIMKMILLLHIHLIFLYLSIWIL